MQISFIYVFQQLNLILLKMLLSNGFQKSLKGLLQALSLFYVALVLKRGYYYYVIIYN